MNYIKYIFISVGILVYSSCVYSQEGLIIKHNDLTVISSVNWKDFEYKEIKNIDSIISKKDILILSEEDHGHGVSMDAKCMILKGLIDSSKINVLYLESSWINCNRIMEILLSKGVEGIQESVKFMQTYDLLYFVKTGFWEYLAKKIISGDLILRGFDIAGISPIIAKELFEESIELKLSKEYASSHSEEFNRIKWSFEFFYWNTGSYYRKDFYKEMEDYITDVIKEYSSQNNFYKVRHWNSILSLFYWMSIRSDHLKDNKYVNQPENEKQNSQFHSIRDSLMASIFLEEYKKDINRKVVCSMSSYHSIINSSMIQGIENCCKDNNINIMGEILYKKFPKKIYSICFITGSGKYGIDDFGIGNGTKIKKPVKGSVEFVLNKLKIKYCFIDLSALTFHKEFSMKAVFNRYLKSNWKNNFSGIFFIQKMEPLVLIK